MRTIAVILIAMAFAPATVDAKCARMGQRPIVLTPDVTVPAGSEGGIVIGTEAIGWDQDDEGQAEKAPWGFITGDDLEQAKVTPLAPGLIVLTTQQPGTGGERELGTKKAVIRWGKDKVPLLAAPKVRAVTYKVVPGMRGTNERTMIELSADPPAGAVAVILADAKTGKARTWAKAEGRSIAADETRRCAPMPDGTIRSKPGDKVTVRWVDKHGRLSPPSGTIVVAALR